MENLTCDTKIYIEYYVRSDDLMLKSCNFSVEINLEKFIDTYSELLLINSNIDRFSYLVYEEKQLSWPYTKKVVRSRDEYKSHIEKLDGVILQLFCNNNFTSICLKFLDQHMDICIHRKKWCDAICSRISQMDKLSTLSIDASPCGCPGYDMGSQLCFCKKIFESRTLTFLCLHTKNIEQDFFESLSKSNVIKKVIFNIDNNKNFLMLCRLLEHSAFELIGITTMVEIDTYYKLDDLESLIVGALEKLPTNIETFSLTINLRGCDGIYKLSLDPNVLESSLSKNIFLKELKINTIKSSTKIVHSIFTDSQMSVIDETINSNYNNTHVKNANYK